MVVARTGDRGNSEDRRRQQYSSARCSEREIDARRWGTAGLDAAARLPRHTGALYDAAASRVGGLLRDIRRSQALCECGDTKGLHVVFAVVVGVDAVLHDVQ